MTSSIPDFLYGTAWKEERTAALTELALRAGFRGIDTANQRRHYYEEGVGHALAAAYRAGIVRREELFLQTKFTYRPGQDHRLPFDPEAPFAEQVRQSLASSLQHLGTDYVDSFVLHGPWSGRDWSDIDGETWQAMLAERAAGRARSVGVSNISLRQLEQMTALDGAPPACVQNRCFARFQWDAPVRRFCAARGIVYQGFSLLTANREVLAHPWLGEVAARLHATRAQVVFAFARAAGMLPLTGTTDPEHMRQDLASRDLTLTANEVAQLETLAVT